MTRETAIEYLKTIHMKECAEFEPIGTWYKGIEDKYNCAISAGIEALEHEKQIEAILDSSLDDDEKVPVIRLIISGGLRRPI